MMIRVSIPYIDEQDNYALYSMHSCIAYTIRHHYLQQVLKYIMTDRYPRSDFLSYRVCKKKMGP